MYNDGLVTVTEDSLIIKDYYFPSVSKQIPFSGILSVKVLEPNLMNGQWKIWGMGLLPIWFALDWKRPSRDAIFIVNIQDSSLKAGFTCESSIDVIHELRARNVPFE